MAQKQSKFIFFCACQPVQTWSLQLILMISLHGFVDLLSEVYLTLWESIKTNLTSCPNHFQITSSSSTVDLTSDLAAVRVGGGRRGCQVLHAKNVICCTAREAGTCHIHERGFHDTKAVEIEICSRTFMSRRAEFLQLRQEKTNTFKVSFIIKHFKISLSRWVANALYLVTLWRVYVLHRKSVHMSYWNEWKLC